MDGDMFDLRTQDAKVKFTEWLQEEIFPLKDKQRIEMMGWIIQICSEGRVQAFFDYNRKRTQDG